MSYLGHSFGGVLLFCREAVDVFYSPNRVGPRWESLTLCSEAVGVFHSHSHSHSRLGPHWVSLTPLQRSSRCIRQPQPTGSSLGESYPFVEKQSVSSTATADWVLIRRVLPLCREAVGVFDSPCRLGNILERILAHLSIQFNVFKYCYFTLSILSDINHLLAQSITGVKY